MHQPSSPQGGSGEHRKIALWRAECCRRLTPRATGKTQSCSRRASTAGCWRPTSRRCAAAAARRSEPTRTPTRPPSASSSECCASCRPARPIRSASAPPPQHRHLDDQGLLPPAPRPAAPGVAGGRSSRSVRVVRGDPRPRLAVRRSAAAPPRVLELRYVVRRDRRADRDIGR